MVMMSLLMVLMVMSLKNDNIATMTIPMMEEEDDDDEQS